MWKEYINPQSKHAKKNYLDFISKFPTTSQIYTSGHASADCLAAVCNLVNPTLGIIPIHSENSSHYQKLPLSENLKNKMWDDYEITISVAKEMIESLPVDDSDEKTIVKNAEKIRKEIKDLGEVSVGAIEEYKSTKERYDFISNQKADLEETKKKLENLINNMTSIMKQQFEKQFKLINENFNETFKELFGGGKAELKLEDESNVLSSGIEIEVQPPGKKLQSMMLLSGGERALTATALLFAILKLKAPPFCILDEIEAALDDVNVHRFAEYIKKYSKNTQFIVITHRKGTMEVASSTYGVTMQEYGISKVVSMKMK